MRNSPITPPARQPLGSRPASSFRNTTATTNEAVRKRKARKLITGRIATASCTITNVRPQTAAIPTKPSSASGADRDRRDRSSAAVLSPMGSREWESVLRKTEVDSSLPRIGPASADDFGPRVELDALDSVDVSVPEQRVLPAPERVVRHGNGDGDVYPHHAYFHLMLKLPRRPSIIRKDRRPVPIGISINDLHRLVISRCPQHHQHRSEDLVPVDRHIGSHAVEQTGAEPKASFVPLDGHVTVVDGERRPFPDAGLEVRRDLVLVLTGHQRPHLSRIVCSGPHLQLIDASAYLVEQRVGR